MQSEPCLMVVEEAQTQAASLSVERQAPSAADAGSVQKRMCLWQNPVPLASPAQPIINSRCRGVAFSMRQCDDSVGVAPLQRQARSEEADVEV